MRPAACTPVEFCARQCLSLNFNRFELSQTRSAAADAILMAMDEPTVVPYLESGAVQRSFAKQRHGLLDGILVGRGHKNADFRDITMLHEIALHALSPCD
jgi:hypothetical protein